MSRDKELAGIEGKYQDWRLEEAVSPKKGDLVVNKGGGRELKGGGKEPETGVIQSLSKGYAYVDFGSGSSLSPVAVSGLTLKGKKGSKNLWEDAPVITEKVDDMTFHLISDLWVVACEEELKKVTKKLAIRFDEADLKTFRDELAKVAKKLLNKTL